jgi:subtilisin family serine protease
MRIGGGVCLALRHLALGITVAGLSSSGIAIAAGQAKLGSVLSQRVANGDARYDVMVYLQDQLDAQNVKGDVYGALVAKTSAQASLQAWSKSRGLKVESFYLVNALAIYGVSATELKELAARGDVLKIRDNRWRQLLAIAASTTPDNLSPKTVEASLTAVGAPVGWENGYRGQGVVVGGQDTGIDWDHPALRGSYRGSNADGTVAHDYNWYDSVRSGSSSRCGSASAEPCDDHGHGTHTLGTVLGDDGQGNQVGMAPQAKWIGCRNMDAGAGRPSTYLACFQFFFAPFPLAGDPARDGRRELAAHVMNNSWGCPSSEGCEGDEFVEVLTVLRAAGVMVVAAAGNEGSGCGTIADAPAHHSDIVFAVGAMDHRSGNIASFSSRGPAGFSGLTAPHVTAPGVSIRSSIPGGGYSSVGWSGTSMASPHVAGMVAQLWSEGSALRGQVAATEDLIKRTATPKTSTQTCGGTPGTSVPNNTFGYGVIDVARAVSELR